MTANTPIYAFTYPCPGETVDPAAIALLAGQIDTKLSDVNADWINMLNRRNTDFFGATQNIATGVDTQLTSPQFTILEAGVYIVTCNVVNVSTPATLNSLRARPRINATTRFGITQRVKNLAQFPPIPSVPMICVAGDVISMNVFYSGAGTMDVQGTLSIKQLCRIA